MSLIEAILIFLSTICLIYLFKKVALKKQIFAQISDRSLHEIIVVRGGGVVLGILFFFIMFFYLLKQKVETWQTISMGLCGLFATLIGFFDDIYDINAKKKFIMQLLLSILFTASYFYFFIFYEFFENNIFLILITICIWVFVPVWIINSFNFIDGINGLAIGTSIFSAGALILSLYFSKGNSNFITIYSLLLVLCLGFLPFNFPAAKLFMGDAGSIFLGFVYGSSVLVILFNNYLSIWTVISIFSYMLADTLSTNIIRLFTIKKWYGVHRSHAYQNIARVLNNHTKVTGGIMLYNLFYVLPLTLFTVWFPNFAIYYTIAAVVPSIIFSIKYGPLYSNK
jgi:Fuc2NAc and GlcNAc transferase